MADPYRRKAYHRPELVWIEGRCYRVNNPATEVSALKERDLYEMESTYNNVEEEVNEEDDDFEIKMVNSSRYSTSFHVSQHYLGYIIGRKGATKMRIEHETKTEIKIPKQGQRGDVVVFGASDSNVKAARKRINRIVISSRLKQNMTHFISIPVNNQDIMKNFEHFKDVVLRECPSEGLEDSIFIQAAKLHLTIGIMCLMDNEERQFVSKLLQAAKDEVMMPILQGHLPLRLRVKGLAYMNDDPKEIHVLYANVQEEGGPPGLLQTLADSIVDYCHKAGFMKKEEYDRNNVKLHVTLLNTKYRERSSANNEDTEDSRKSRREPFDGSDILQKFADYDFGIAELTDIHLSQRHAVGADGYYKATCVISCK